MRATYPVNITHLPTPINASRTSFDPWPFKVDVREEEEKKKVGVIPECRDGDGRSVSVLGLLSERKVRGREIVQDEDDEGGCSCLYANYGLVDSDEKNVVGRGEGGFG